MAAHAVRLLGSPPRGAQNDSFHGERAACQPRRGPTVRGYFQLTQQRTNEGWLSHSEFPSSDEVLRRDHTGQAPANMILGPWASKEEYLSSLYTILREDAVGPVRKAVSQVRLSPDSVEGAFEVKIGIYEKVHICGLTLSPRGVAVRVSFSIARVGKQIAWEQSKRFLPGRLVVLTPSYDMFERQAIVATVAARPIAGLQLNPPEIDLYFARAEELEIDPAVEYVMIEDPSSYFEAERHTLLALQHMSYEPFPLSEHLVDVQADVPAPPYIREHPEIDISPILTANHHGMYKTVDILNGWPEELPSSLDATQLAALRRILAKQLAIVQGPPGTGKTHVSVQAIKIMLSNRNKGDPPIVIACQTNDAVDQILRQVATFEPNFVRLGGGSKDESVIKPRTLPEVRQKNKKSLPKDATVGGIFKEMGHIKNDFEAALNSLGDTQRALDHRDLEALHIITKAQAASLDKGASRWVRPRQGSPVNAPSPFNIWLGDKLLPVPRRQTSEDFGFPMESIDLELEQLTEHEAGRMDSDENHMEALPGTFFALADNYTCDKGSNGRPRVQDILREQDLWKVPEAYRGTVYRHFQRELKARVCSRIRNRAKRFNELVKSRSIAWWDQDTALLAEQNIIGMTTTGLGKFRALISALQPKIALIEEAAQILEPPVTVACMPSLQHLILVGDHQQLRPSTRVHRDGTDALNNFDISLFERMVGNNVEFTMLTRQRRMIPEIRRLLNPIYRNLIIDDNSVTDPTNRPDVPGMGGINSYFFTHTWPEQGDGLTSYYNSTESLMISGLVKYLVLNGMDTENITILTFYNTQREKILSELQAQPTLKGRRFNVASVDSYQGKENHVIILSLVRSNDRNKIGFLSVVNRICVALSRAQCGLYIFGNSSLLCRNSATWRDVCGIMAHETTGLRPTMRTTRLGGDLPLQCAKHGAATYIKNPDDWKGILGGCERECNELLKCGHTCVLKCHPFPHDFITCETCTRNAAHAAIIAGGRRTTVISSANQRVTQLTGPEDHTQADLIEASHVRPTTLVSSWSDLGSVTDDARLIRPQGNNPHPSASLLLTDLSIDEVDGEGPLITLADDTSPQQTALEPPGSFARAGWGNTQYGDANGWASGGGGGGGWEREESTVSLLD